MKDKIIKLLELRHPECFFKPTTFKVDREVLTNELMALLQAQHEQDIKAFEDLIGEDQEREYNGEGDIWIGDEANELRAELRTKLDQYKKENI